MHCNYCEICHKDHEYHKFICMELQYVHACRIMCISYYFISDRHTIIEYVYTFGSNKIVYMYFNFLTRSTFSINATVSLCRSLARMIKICHISFCFCQLGKMVVNSISEKMLLRITRVLVRVQIQFSYESITFHCGNSLASRRMRYE